MLAAIANALRAAASALTSAAGYCWWATTWVAAAPFRMVGGMLGGGAGTVPLPPATASDDTKSAGNEVRRAITAAARRRAAADALPHGLTPETGNSVGEVVHRYARTAPADRPKISLEALSPTQAAWLLRLRPDQLEQLALAGPRACGRLADGRRCSTVSVDPCRRSGPADLPEVEETETVRRFDRARSRRYATAFAM